MARITQCSTPPPPPQNMPKIFQDRSESGLELLHILIFTDSTADYHSGATEVTIANGGAVLLSQT